MEDKQLNLYGLKRRFDFLYKLSFPFFAITVFFVVFFFSGQGSQEYMSYAMISILVAYACVHFAETKYAICPHCQKSIEVKFAWVCEHCGNKQKEPCSIFDICDFCKRKLQRVYCEFCHKEIKF